MRYHKPDIGNIRINSFWPLCKNTLGKKAIASFGFPPFIDASCRREPDLENKYPSITSLCRAGSFAPGLQPNDIVVYLAAKNRWETTYRHYRLVAILEVIRKAPSHEEAALWYKERNLPVPSNCMIPTNNPRPFEETSGDFKTSPELKRFMEFSSAEQAILGKKLIERWDKRYLERSQRWPGFIITQPIFRELHDPPILNEQDILNIFGKTIYTLAPPTITISEFRHLASLVGIDYVI